MVELDNLEHETRLEEVREAEVGRKRTHFLFRLIRECQDMMRRFCESLPEDRILRGNDCDVNYLLEKDSRKRTFKVSSTGAVLTYHSALSVLARYASSLVRTPWSSCFSIPY